MQNNNDPITPAAMDTEASTSTPHVRMDDIAYLWDKDKKTFISILREMSESRRQEVIKWFLQSNEDAAVEALKYMWFNK